MSGYGDGTYGVGVYGGPAELFVAGAPAAGTLVGRILAPLPLFVRGVLAPATAAGRVSLPLDLGPVRGAAALGVLVGRAGFPLELGVRGAQALGALVGRVSLKSVPTALKRIVVQLPTDHLRLSLPSLLRFVLRLPR